MAWRTSFIKEVHVHPSKDVSELMGDGLSPYVPEGYGLWIPCSIVHQDQQELVLGR